MTDVTPLLATPHGRKLLEQLAAELDVDADCLSDLLRASERHAGQLRRKGLFQAFDAVLDASRR